MRLQYDLMKDELGDANDELARVRNKLAWFRARSRALDVPHLGKLRREVAFHCHPDRGGDAEVMSKVNTLFDLLQRSRELFAAASEAE